MGHSSGGVAQRADHVAEGQEPAVDGDPLLSPVPRSPGPLEPLRPGQVDKVELGGQGLDLGSRPGGRRRSRGLVVAGLKRVLVTLGTGKVRKLLLQSLPRNLSGTTLNQLRHF